MKQLSPRLESGADSYKNKQNIFTYNFNYIWVFQGGIYQSIVQEKEDSRLRSSGVDLFAVWYEIWNGVLGISCHVLTCPAFPNSYPTIECSLYI